MVQELETKVDPLLLKLGTRPAEKDWFMEITKKSLDVGFEIRRA